MPMMRESRMPDDWIMRMVAQNPIQKVLDPATGAWTGNIRLCPARLSYFNDSLFVAQGGNDDRGQPKKPTFEVQLLLPPCAADQVNTILRPILDEFERKTFQQNIDPATNSLFGLHSPIRDQGEKRQYSGYTPGGALIRATTQFMPQIVDAAMNPIVDHSRAYPGVWAIVAVNMFGYGVAPPRPKRGVSFGLQVVALVADDNKLGAGAVDPKKVMAGVNIDSRFDPTNALAGGSNPPPAQRRPPPPPPLPAYTTPTDDIPF